MATPIDASPDEPVQLIKAAAVARAEFYGTPGPNISSGTSPYITVKVPKAIADGPVIPSCFAFRNNVPASCSPQVGTSKKLVSAQTYVGRYEPLYYLLTGWPSLLSVSSLGIRLIRLVSLLLCCYFIASAFDSAASSRRRALAVVGVAIALTPMVVFLVGTVNPNGLEIAAAICLWASGLVLVTEPEPEPGPQDRRLMTRIGLSAAVMVEMRALSPVWLVLILAWVASYAHRERLVAIARERRTWVWAGIVGLSAAFALFWIVRYDTLAVAPTPPLPTDRSVIGLAAQAFDRTDGWLRQMIGNVGWTDTPSPAVTFYGWTGLTAVAFGVGLMVGRLRKAASLGVLALAVVVIPAAISSREATRFGFIWQGRYTLPLAVGIPILAAFAMPERASALMGRFLRPRLVLVAVIVVAQAAMFLTALRRYTVGLSGTLNPFRGSWSPPLGAAGVAALFLVGLLGFAVWLAFPDMRLRLPGRLSPRNLGGRSARLE